MPRNKSLLSDMEIIELYEADTDISIIESSANISRQAIYNCLKRNGIDVNRKAVLTLTCRYCKGEYERIRGRVKGKEHEGYCSTECFHSDRRISDMEELTESEIRYYRKLARKVIEATGRKLRKGSVVHHRDGNLRNYDIENLRVFRNHSTHMKFHHSLRGKDGLRE